MRQFAFMAGAAWLAASVICTGTASAAMSGPPQHKAYIHNKLAAKQAQPPRVSEASARRIAWRSGLDHIEEIALLGEHWEVAGRDREGNEMTLAIHAHDGSVLD
ncbi:MAG TPA: hypothetical protein VIU82_08240 [Bosea sp. (in: a-proteobacteria)]